MPNQVVFRRPFRRRGQNFLPGTSLIAADVTGSGGVLWGGSADVRFGHTPQVPSNVVVEWDFDNDGDFSDPEEDITSYVLGLETFTGRDWPSLLTGKAGPGKLSLTLRNDDDRFNYFNTASPLATPPNSLRTGRKIRVRTTESANPDPDPLAKDRFRRADGALGDDEFGTTWTNTLSDDLEIETNRVVATSEGDDHMATLDLNAADYYVQMQATTVGLEGNRIGLVYRYADASNYSMLLINVSGSSLALVDVVAGEEISIAGAGVEVYSGITIGVLVSDTSVTAYLEGVPVFSATAINTTADVVGMYLRWATGEDRPEIDNFYAWSGVPIEVEGILWTGDVSEVISNVTAGPQKLARASAEGSLARLATQRITPPASLSGRRTGLLMGNTLANASVLQPPGEIALGDVTTGVFAMEENDAIEVARRVEETEFGFLYEMQEGPIAFQSRTGRDAETSAVVFSDSPGSTFTYTEIEPFDWKKEVFNRVVAGVSPWTEGSPSVLFTDPGPYTLMPGESRALVATYEGVVVSWQGHTRDVTAPGGDPADITTDDYTDENSVINVPLPSTVNAGDLLLIAVAVWPEGGSAAGFLDVNPPSGFTSLQTGTLDRVVAKVAVGDEDSSTAQFEVIGTFSGTWTAQVYRVEAGGWIGSLSGVTATVGVFGSGATPNPPAVTFPWGPLPSLVIPYAWWPYDRSVNAIPASYTDELFTEILDSGINNIDMGMVSAQRIVTGATSTDPGTFTLSASVNQWRTRTIAVQGPVTTTPVASAVPSGSDPAFTISYDAGLGGSVQTHANIEVTGVPLTEGDQQLVQADDFTSQDDHNAIRTYTNAANLFATAADAETYTALVLARYADDRPILSISFVPVKSAAYRAQAIRRRVSDRITLVATNNAGLGVSQDFYIESIGHRWSNGVTMWETTWELSPVPT